MSLESDWIGDVAPARGPIGRPARDPRNVRTRLRKVECLACGCIARMSAAAIRKAGAPSCGCGAGPMHLPEIRDRAAVDWDAVAVELATYSADALRNAERELGGKMAPARSQYERSSGDRKRCAVIGCGAFVRGTYCDDHADKRSSAYDAWRY